MKKGSRGEGYFSSLIGGSLLCRPGRTAGSAVHLMDGRSRRSTMMMTEPDEWNGVLPIFPCAGLPLFPPRFLQRVAVLYIHTRFACDWTTEVFVLPLIVLFYIILEEKKASDFVFCPSCVAMLLSCCSPVFLLRRVVVSSSRYPRSLDLGHEFVFRIQVIVAARQFLFLLMFYH